MNNIKENIDFLKDFVQKRETYIRFSALGTAIVGIMFIIYYFFGDNINIEKSYLFLSIGILGIIILTILSILNSKNKGEEILPQSIKYIIINLIFMGIAYFSLVLNILASTNLIIISSFIFYGLLIVVSRFCIPNYIKYFGLVVFFSGIISLICISKFNYINELVLLILGFGHLIIAYLLKINNDK